MKNKIDIAKIIMVNFDEVQPSKRYRKCQEDFDIAYNKLNDSLNPKQRKLLSELDEIDGDMCARREDELIKFVLDFVAACFK